MPRMFSAFFFEFEIVMILSIHGGEEKSIADY